MGILRILPFSQSSEFLKIIWRLVYTGRRQRRPFDSWSQARRSAAWSGELLFNQCWNWSLSVIRINPAKTLEDLHS